MILAIISYLAITCFVQGGEKENFDNVFGEIKVSQSEASLLNSKANTVTFKGEKVEVRIGKTLLICEKIVIQFDDEKKPVSFVATAKMVAVEREDPNGHKQIAKSRMAKWDAESGKIEISGGPPTLQSNSTLVKPPDINAKIFLLSGGRFEVSGRSIIGLGGIRSGNGDKVQIPSGNLNSMSRRR